jgi:hypothetical protein
MSRPLDSETAMLISFLDAQRDSVLAIVRDLSDDALRTQVLPSGWSPLGLIEHLGHAERHWCQEVGLGSAGALPWVEEWDPDAPFVTERSRAAVFAFYRQQSDRSNAILAGSSLSTVPLGRHEGDDLVPVDFRWIALHLIEETARHAGHLDVVRELLDGHTGLGPR